MFKPVLIPYFQKFKTNSTVEECNARPHSADAIRHQVQNKRVKKMECIWIIVLLVVIHVSWLTVRAESRSTDQKRTVLFRFRFPHQDIQYQRNGKITAKIFLILSYHHPWKRHLETLNLGYYICSLLRTITSDVEGLILIPGISNLAAKTYSICWRLWLKMQI